MDKLESIEYDVAIIGGGPAGLMAASRASELGAKVLLIEKNDRPGIKLSITGGGRCNITNYIEDYKLLAANFDKGGKFLLSAFSKFGAREVVNFFESRGLRTKIEKNNQVFPLSNRSQELIKILTDNIKKRNGKIITGEAVGRIEVRGNKIEKIILASGREIVAKNYILATGGKSYPLTGSTGDAYTWLKEMGHKITLLRPALTQIVVREKYIKELEGLSFGGAKINLYQNNKSIAGLKGDIIFTANGLSGPASLNLSRYVDILSGNFKLGIDFFPKINEDELDKKLQKLFSANGQKTLKNSLQILLSPRLAALIIKLLELDGEKKSGVVQREARLAISKLLKDWRLTIVSLGDYNKAMITRGGLELKEVDPKTMRSKLISNLFVAGELLDLDGPTGGYNLQICWSTGYVAGENSVLEKK